MDQKKPKKAMGNGGFTWFDHQQIGVEWDMMGCNWDVIGIYNQLNMLYKARVIYALCA